MHECKISTYEFKKSDHGRLHQVLKKRIAKELYVETNLFSKSTVIQEHTKVSTEGGLGGFAAKKDFRSEKKKGDWNH